MADLIERLREAADTLEAQAARIAELEGALLKIERSLSGCKHEWAVMACTTARQALEATAIRQQGEGK